MKVSSIVKSPIAQKVTSKINQQKYKIAASTMMMSAVLGGVGVVNAKTFNNNSTTNQTELVSASGAEALSSAVLLLTLQQRKAHNYKLDKKYIDMEEAYGKDFDRQKVQDEVNALYSTLGTFKTSIILQLGIQSYGLIEMFDSMHEDLINYESLWNAGHISNDDMPIDDALSVASQRVEVCSWYDNQFIPYVMGKMNDFNVYTSEEAYSQVIDSVYYEIFTSESARANYHNAINDFKSTQQCTNSIQKASELLAFKTTLLSYSALFAKLNQMGKIGDGFLAGSALNNVFKPAVMPEITTNEEYQLSHPRDTRTQAEVLEARDSIARELQRQRYGL